MDRRLAGLIIGAVAAAATGVEAAEPAKPAFDAHSPAALQAVIARNGASVTLKKDDKGKPFLDGKAGRLFFTTDFYECDAQFLRCGLTVYTSSWDATDITQDQINQWNQRAILCPAYLTEQKKPFVWYGLLVADQDTEATVAAQLGRYLDCAESFDDFVADPPAYLKPKG